MKKYIIAAVLAISAVIVAACADLFGDTIKPSKKYKFVDLVITAQQGVSTKTSITPDDNGGLSSTWRPGDALYVYCDGEQAGKVMCVGGISTDSDGNSVAVFKGRISVPKDYRYDGGSDSYGNPLPTEEDLVELMFLYPGSDDFMMQNRQNLDYYENCSDHKHHHTGYYARLDLKPEEEISQLRKYDFAAGMADVTAEGKDTYTGTVKMVNLLSFVKVSTLDLPSDVVMNGCSNGMIYMYSKETTENLDGTPMEDDYSYEDEYEAMLMAFPPANPVILPAGKDAVYIPLNVLVGGSGMFDVFDEYFSDYDSYSSSSRYVYLRGRDSEGNVWGIPSFKIEQPGKLYMNADGSSIAIERLDGDLDMGIDFEDRYTNDLDLYLNRQ